MTLEEALSSVADSEKRAFIEKMIKDQNSYITKLENQLKATPQPSAPNGTNDVTMKYLEKNMRRDVIAEAEQQILASISPEVYAAVKPDYMDFLDKKMTREYTTVEYAVDAFALVLGRCMSNKDHAVNKIGKAAPPGDTPKQQVQAGTNGQAVADVQNILKTTAPVMTGKDSGSQTGMPNVGGQPIKNTKDAFSALKNRFAANGENKFN